MKKSEIVVAVFLKSFPAKSKKQILGELTTFLADQSIGLDQWDATVPDPVANAMIKNIASTRGQAIKMEYVVRDIDIILNRIS